MSDLEPAIRLQASAVTASWGRPANVAWMAGSRPATTEEVSPTSTGEPFADADQRASPTATSEGPADCNLRPFHQWRPATASPLTELSRSSDSAPGAPGPDRPPPSTGTTA